MKQITRLHGFFHPMIKFHIKGWKNPCALLAVCLLPVLSPDLSHALEWKDVWQTPDQQGEILLQQQKSEQAAETFEHPGWKAAALYRAEKYKESAESLDDLESADARYNRGNALAKSGDLKAAVQAYEQALKIDKAHEDAGFNLELVKKAMHNQQSEQQQSEDQNKSDKSDKSEQQSGEKNQDQQSGQPDENSEQSEQQSSESEKDQSENQSGQKNDSDDSSADSRQQQQSEQEEQGENEQSQSSQNDQTQDEAEKDKEQEQQSSETQERNKAEAEEEKVKASVQEKETNRENTEEMKAQQQWLRRIPDDPGGLLRRKFRYQYRQRGQQPGSKEGQAW